MTPEVANTYLALLQRALVLARSACQASDLERTEAILDAIHNLPGFLAGAERPGFEAEFVSHYLDPLIRRYPDLKELADSIS